MKARASRQAARRKRAFGALLGAVLLVAGALGAFLALRPAPAGVAAGPAGAPAMHGALGLELDEGDLLAYELEIDTLFRTNPSAGPSGAEVAGRRHLTGELLLRIDVVAEEPAGRAYRGTALLRPVRLTEDERSLGELERGLGVPSRFELDQHGRLTALGCDAALGPAVHNEWLLLWQLLEFDLEGSGAGAASWRAEGTDATGTYLSEYRRLPVEGAPRLERRRLDYLGVLGAEPLRAGEQAPRAHIVHSLATATFHPRGKWLAATAVREHLRLKRGGTLLGEADTRGRLRVIDLARARAAFHSLAVPSVAWRRDSDALEPLSALPYADRPPVAGLGARELDGVLGDVSALLAGGDLRAATELLVQYLRARPEAAAALVAVVRAGGASDEFCRLAFFGLQAAGGAEAHAALAQATHDPALSGENRLRAVVALSSVPDPTDDVAESVVAASRTAGDGAGAEDVRRSAHLGVGALADNAALGAVGREKVHARLGEALDEARAPSDLSLALDAIGNSRDARYAARVREHLRDESAIVTTAAFRTLAKMGSLPASEELFGALEGFADPGARDTVAQLVSDNVAQVEVDVAGTILRLGSEVAQVRALAILLLGSVAKEDPSARTALIAHYAVEPLTALRALIGRYVTALELAGAM
ncbi:MAG: hypothetical protein HY908_37520 [Myxococcales bacterium]|nr:hypothetical protein [Myxococcales bacterium]